MAGNIAAEPEQRAQRHVAGQQDDHDEDRRREEDRDRLDDQHRARRRCRRRGRSGTRRRRSRWRRPRRPPPHSTSTSGSPVTHRAMRTGTAPLSRSPRTTTAAHLRPSARRALVPPVRPEPTERRSGPPTRRATSAPTGMDPSRYDTDHEPSAVRIRRVQRDASERVGGRRESSTGETSDRPAPGGTGRSIRSRRDRERGYSTVIVGLDDGRAEDAVGVHRRGQRCPCPSTARAPSASSSRCRRGSGRWR